MTENKPKADWSEIEIYKLEFEYLKHLTTISTGSILLLVAFLDKIFTQAKCKSAIAVSLISFLLSIILCAISQATIIEKASEKDNLTWRNKIQNLTVGLFLFALLSYVIGVISLVAFGLKNLF